MARDRERQREAAMRREALFAVYRKLVRVAAAIHVGTDPIQQLSWALRAARAATDASAPEHWAALAYFARGERASEPRAGILLPSDSLRIRRRFAEIITQVVGRHSVPIGEMKTHVSLTWDRIAGRFRLAEEHRGVDDWEHDALKALTRLLAAYGHLVRACPAPAVRSDRKPCGAWFVANRPRQIYCSSTCQTRTTTRAARSQRGKS